MIPEPEEILNRIAQRTLLDPAGVSVCDHDAILDDRDGNSDFEARWLQCHKDIEAKWDAYSEASSKNAIVEDVQRESFLAVSNATNHHEIASYVSDNFDIIVRAGILGVDDAFLNELWSTYDRGDLPDSTFGK